jgi:type I restriction enzyme M protein
MITTSDINTILGIKENFQLHGALKDILFDEDKKTEVFEKFLEIENDLSYDWFTNYFQTNQSDRDSLMQDYTPDCICKIIQGLQKPNGIILDECSGIGGLTISTWNQNKSKTFYCEELSDNSVMLLLFNLSIRNIKAYVRHGNVLTNEFNTVYQLTPGEKFSNIQVINQDNEYEVDAVVSNPPYSLKFDNIDCYTNDSRYAYFGLPPKSKADYAFMLHGLSHLKEDGEAFFIIPHGVLFRGSKEEKIRKKLIESNLLDAVIALPEKLFLNTAIPVAIMVFKMNRKNKDILFIDGSKLFKKNGKQNNMTKNHIDKILSAYNLRTNVDKMAHVATYEEIEENDFNLNIPRYVDTFEEKEPIDLEENIRTIRELEDEIANTSKELADMMKDLKGAAEYAEYRDDLVDHLENKDTHAVSDTTSLMDQAIEDMQGLLVNQKEVKFYDIATFERSKKNKIYPAGSILIQVSATKGQIEYHDHDGTVEDKFGVIQTNAINPKYLFYVLEMVMPDFLRKYQTGLNINPKIFKLLKFSVHTDPTTQWIIVKMLDYLKNVIFNEEKYLGAVEDVKQIHLDGMFI